MAPRYGGAAYRKPTTVSNAWNLFWASPRAPARDDGRRPGTRMQSLKRMPIASVAMLLLVLGIGYLLPGAWQVERSVVIRAPAAAIFPHLNSLKQWRDWTGWVRTQRAP